MKTEWDILSLNRLFSIISIYDLPQDDLYLSPNEGHSVNVYINCSDTFMWACADAEYIYPSDLDNIEQSVKDLKESAEYAEVYWDILWISRKRRQLPAESWFRREAKDPKVYQLFQAIKGEK